MKSAILLGRVELLDLLWHVLWADAEIVSGGEERFQKHVIWAVEVRLAGLQQVRDHSELGTDG